MKKLLVVDDEKDVLELLRYRFETDGWSVVTTDSGARAIEVARSQSPTAILLDVMMPGTDGLDVLRALRREPRTSAIPVLLVTAKGAESDRIVGLELGADDYVVKPFSPREVVARVKAVLRRTERRADEPPPVVESGPIKLDATRREVVVGGGAVALTTTEFDILRVLMANRGRVFTRAELMERVRGTDTIAADRVIDAHVAAVRRKLGDEAGAWIETVRGYGYRFRDAG